MPVMTGHNRFDQHVPSKENRSVLRNVFIRYQFEFVEKTDDDDDDDEEYLRMYLCEKDSHSS